MADDLQSRKIAILAAAEGAHQVHDEGATA